ncbi:MAG: phenylacetate--CoA ligase family protein [Planctomycetes bacterium]|nr:phenylacetate--CoA ligase family protein [Planctomycetota bacterium]MBL7142820.1 phenylacetate--CoA ligase family protein [Phycisphaerae bacterium]
MSILNLLQAVRSAKKAESLSPQQIHDLQQKRFKKLLRHVLQKSRFYKKYYKEHGITERDVDKVLPEDLPVIDKQIMMENYDDLVCDPALKKSSLEQFINESPDAGTKYKNVYRVINTSGSSGTIGLFVYGPRDWVIARALSLRIAGIPIHLLKREKLAFIGATDGHYAVITGVCGAPRILFKVLSLSISSPLEKICRDMDRFQPDALVGYASGVSLLAHEQLSGNINIAPKKIWCGGDPLNPAIRTNIKKAFDVNPINLYGASETMSFSAECKRHHRLHFFDDWFSVQVVDKDLKPVMTGQAGRVILTNLYNYTQPLIRYQMNDEIVLSDEPCQCGWPFQIIEKIAGRHEEFLWFTKTDGSKEFIHPIVLVEFFVPGLEKYQFFQTGTDRLLMKAVINGEKDSIVPVMHNRMSEILSQKSLEDTVQFDIELVDEIQNDPKTGKFRLIIPFAKQ